MIFNRKGLKVHNLQPFFYPMTMNSSSSGTGAEVKVRMLANERRGKKVFHSVSDDGTSYEW